jgi:hypothetical protein
VGVNLPLARAVLSGCLIALKWMLWVTAAILVVMFVIAFRGSEGESPLKPIAFGIVVSLAGGWLCGRFARVVENHPI